MFPFTAVLVLMVVFMMMVALMSMVVFMLMVVLMFLVVFVLMVILMLMAVFMPMVAIVMLMLMFVEFHDCPCSGDAAAFVPNKIQLPARKAEGAQRGPQFPGINAQIDKGPQRHIPRNACVTVKVQNLHAPLLADSVLFTTLSS
jgi:energy-coupling factor transporter transmembrane protein EcfT